jgi:hypothetical protein
MRLLSRPSKKVMIHEINTRPIRKRPNFWFSIIAETSTMFRSANRTTISNGCYKVGAEGAASSLRHASLYQSELAEDLIMRDAFAACERSTCAVQSSVRLGCDLFFVDGSRG